MYDRVMEAGMSAPSHPVPRRPRNKRGEGQKLYDEIVEAASTLLEEYGDIEKVTLREIAQRVGITVPAIYLHFPSKENLIAMVTADAWRGLAARMNEASASQPNPFVALRQRGVAYCRFAVEFPATYRFIMMEKGHTSEICDMTRTLRIEVYNGLLADVARCAGKGLFSSGLSNEEVCQQLLFALHGACSMLTTYWDLPEHDALKLADRMVSIAGLGAAIFTRLPSRADWDPNRIIPMMTVERIAGVLDRAGQDLVEQALLSRLEAGDL